ncbi:hypothetical protein DPMN_054860 [Dreissena polymorpha]|uniref:Uncharacterized protein n=1 Tax=Dreissena polymorpha TaxID=45954 RepID=A0A9D4CPP3_DREPO|nr:hypothetical protein DPMN_054860 [Dreissena polymorpha]
MSLLKDIGKRKGDYLELLDDMDGHFKHEHSPCEQFLTDVMDTIAEVDNIKIIMTVFKSVSKSNAIDSFDGKLVLGGHMLEFNLTEEILTEDIPTEEILMPKISCQEDQDKQEIARDLLSGSDENDEETADVDELLETVTSSQTARLLRLIIGMPPGSEDSDSEEDLHYRPEEEWKKYVFLVDDLSGVGLPGQCAGGLCMYGVAPAYENEDRLLWDPSRMNDMLADSHRVHAVPTGAHVRDDEQSEAHMYITWHVCVSNPMSLWSEEECSNFETGLRFYGKDLYMIHQNKSAIIISHSPETEAVDFFGATLNTYVPRSGKKFKYRHIRKEIADGYPAYKMRIRKEDDCDITVLKAGDKICFPYGDKICFPHLISHHAIVEPLELYEREAAHAVKIALIGKMEVGKTSLINALLGRKQYEQGELRELGTQFVFGLDDLRDLCDESFVLRNKRTNCSVCLPNSIRQHIFLIDTHEPHLYDFGKLAIAIINARKRKKPDVHKTNSLWYKL